MDLPRGRGRQIALAAKFGVSPNAARKWLLDLGMLNSTSPSGLSAAHANVLLPQGVGPARRCIRHDARRELLDAVQQLPQTTGTVFDFIRYKIERADGWFRVGKKLAHYVAMLDKFGKPTPKKD